MQVYASASADVRQNFEKWPDGDRDAASRLMTLVNQELRTRASGYLRREYPGDTFRANALCQRPPAKLPVEDRVTSKHRALFRAVAANLMRHILVEHARDRNRQQRNGRGASFSLHDTRLIPEEGIADLIALDEALRRFGLAYPRASAVVEMKFFGAMDTGEIAEVLSVPEKTVLSDWRFGKTWLARVLMQRTHDQDEWVAGLFRSISECSEKQLASFVRIPERS